MKRFALVFMLLGSVTASADELYSIGARVGGYGFRRAEDPGLTEGALGDSWSECRMNGLGLFVDRALAGPWFVEGGLDTYFSIGQGEPTDLPLDRESVLLSAAIGARSHFTSWLTGYVQLGGGVELTKLSVPYGDDAIRADKVFPEGFAGVGLDIKIARGTFIGASLRTLVMANFNYQMPSSATMNQWVASPSPDAVFAATPSLAAQGQFYLRRDL
jgi:hypothetical protein